MLNRSLFSLTALTLALYAAGAGDSFAANHGHTASSRTVSVSHRPIVVRSGYYHTGYRGHYFGPYRGRGYYGRHLFYSALTLGLLVPFLPYGYTTYWYGGVPYYVHDHVYYIHEPGYGYRVVEPPVEIEEHVISAPSPEPVVKAPPPSTTPTPTYSQPANSDAAKASSGNLYAYPRNGQNDTLATFDRIECERWGSGQTGYKPGQSAENAERRGDYQRAVSACLEGRGYTVR
ncbi:MAG: hypothetical protein JNM52_06105 [Betaproteobacteria bacterium]|nr:hypothetical protein [Betaproteobacteria bacterium]